MPATETPKDFSSSRAAQSRGAFFVSRSKTISLRMQFNIVPKPPLFVQYGAPRAKLVAPKGYSPSPLDILGASAELSAWERVRDILPKHKILPRQMILRWNPHPTTAKAVV